MSIRLDKFGEFDLAQSSNDGRLKTLFKEIKWRNIIDPNQQNKFSCEERVTRKE